jgi:uncharacterized protein YaaW (UPF0174 family)
METYYFTFGSGQENAGGYVKIIANDYMEARDLMFERYDSKWGFQYNELQFEGQAERFGLYEVETIEGDKNI